MVLNEDTLAPRVRQSWRGSERYAENVCYPNASLVVGIDESATPEVPHVPGSKWEVVRRAAEVLTQRQEWIRCKPLKGGFYPVKGIATARGRKGVDEGVEVFDGLVTYSQLVAHP